MSKKIIFGIFLVLFLISLVFAFDFSSFINLDESVGVLSDLKEGFFSFSEEGGSLYLMGLDGEEYEYSGFLPEGEGVNSFINLAEDGSISNLDLTASEDTNFYLNGLEVPLEKGFRAIYSEGDLEIVSNSNLSRISSLPEMPREIFDSTPKEITYYSEGGSLIVSRGGILYRDYVLEEGLLKYSLENERFFTPKGDFSVIEGFKVDAISEDVVLGKNIKFSKDSIISEGEGFRVSLNSGDSTFFETKEVPVSLESSRNGKYFKVGDEGEDVRQIQKIIGLKNQNGRYDQVTKEAVEKWQSDNGLSSDGLFGKNSLNKVYGKYSFDLSSSNSGNYLYIGDNGEEVREVQRFLVDNGYLEKEYLGASGKLVNSIDGEYGDNTAKALKRWQSDNGLSVDGKFGKNSLKKAKDYENNVVISMNGGSSVLKNGGKGLEIDLEGKTGIIVGNKKYSFDGEDFNQALIPSLTSNTVLTPTEINFEKEGEVFSLSLDSVDSKINSVKLAEAAANAGIRVDQISCSGFTQSSCLLALEGEGGGFANSITSLGGRFTREGLRGHAWQMQENLLNKGGKVIFSKENSLSNSEKLALSGLKERISSGYDPEKREKISDEIRSDLGSILNKDDLSSQVVPLKGDVVSLYFRDSDYLSEALAEGKNNQKNTHMGVIVDTVEDSFSLSENEDLFNQIKKNLGLNEGSSLYVNSYTYQDSETGLLNSLYLNNGKFYLENGDEFTTDVSKEIFINRPRIAHMIHYSSGESPYHIENLDKVVSSDKMSLYGLTRPKSSNYIDDSFNFADSFRKGEEILSCTSLDCGGFDLSEILRANNVPDPEKFAEEISKSTIKRQKEFGIPDSQRDDFVTITNAIIQRESQFGDSEWYKAEKAFNKISPFNTGSEGYMQISSDKIKEYEEKFGEKYSGEDEEHIGYGQRYLAELFREYAPGDEPLKEDQVRVIAAAYNAGKNVPKMAAFQRQLQGLGYIAEDTPLTGSFGPSTKWALESFSKDYGLGDDWKRLNADNFENNIVYEEVLNRYEKKFGVEPERAIVPEIIQEGEWKDPRDWSLKGLRDSSVADYSEGVFRNYRQFCAHCS